MKRTTISSNVANIRDYQRKPDPLPKEASWLQIYIMKGDKRFASMSEYLITVDQGGSFIFAPVIAFDINGEDGSTTLEFYEYDASRNLWIHTATDAYQPGEFEVTWPYSDYIIRHLVKKFSEKGTVKLDCVSASECTNPISL